MKLLCLAALLAAGVLWHPARLVEETARLGLPWAHAIPAASFARYSLMDWDTNGARPIADRLLPAIRRKNALEGQGWVEYDFSTPTSGWYQLLLKGARVDDHDFFIDTVHVYNGSLAGKIGNFFLAAGRHTLRVQRLAFPGLGALEGFTLRRAGDESLAATVRIDLASDRLVFRTGETLALDIRAGARTMPATLSVLTRRTDTNALIETRTIALPAAPGPTTTRVDISCRGEGVFYLSFADNKGPIPADDLRQIQFAVIDTSAAPQNTGADLQKTLLTEIDCAQVPPANAFYQGGGKTRVVTTAAGTYRESGDQGYLQNKNDPSFFAYNLNVPRAQQPYLVAVDYPDDALRTFCIGLQERVMIDYPPVGGVDSGGEWSLSNRLHTQSFLFWPRGTEVRVTFLNAHTGRRAAAARIRLFRIDGDLPPLLPRQKKDEGRRRGFGYWLEEGDRWAAFFGAPDKTLAGHMAGMERWAQAAAYMGATTLAPTLAVYQNVLYPSRFYNGYFRPTGGARDPLPLDLARLLLLVCEKHGLRLLPDFHPTWNGYKRRMVDDAPYASSPSAPPPHLMVARDGKTGDGFFRPYFNPLFPANQDWLIGMAGEFADRYNDSPALEGISLRVMSWAWESRSGYPSLHWGYEDYSVALFERDTGIKIPVAAGDPDRFAKRYDWLVSNARARWVAWRCEKIAALHRRLSARVRQARPDLLLRVPLHGGPLDVGYHLGDDYVRKTDREHGPANGLREAGFDTARLSSPNGALGLINAQAYYGRRLSLDTPAQTAFYEQAGRDKLLDPATLSVFRTPTVREHLFGNTYFEANRVAVPAKVGLENVAPTGFVGVVNPAGRHFLERFAVALAETDANRLLDGGEGYVLGQDQYLRPFLREFCSLPAAPFTPRADARDPVAVWERKHNNSLLFYAVNRERFPVTLTLRLSPGAAVTRLATGAPVAATNGVLRVLLQPYELRAFKGTPKTAITGISVDIPAKEQERMARQVAWLERLAAGVKAGSQGRGLSAEQKRHLADRCAVVRAALQAGHVWRARTLLEHHTLREIYEIAGQGAPPDLRAGE